MYHVPGFTIIINAHNIEQVIIQCDTCHWNQAEFLDPHSESFKDPLFVEKCSKRLLFKEW